MGYQRSRHLPFGKTLSTITVFIQLSRMQVPQVCLHTYFQHHRTNFLIAVPEFQSFQLPASSSSYDRLTHPCPSPIHSKYPFHTPGGADSRWAGHADIEEGSRWVGSMMCVRLGSLRPPFSFLFNTRTPPGLPLRFLDHLTMMAAHTPDNMPLLAGAISGRSRLGSRR